MPQLAVFEGDVLKTQFVSNYQGGGGGVFIDGFAATEAVFLTFQDNTDAERAFDFVAGLTLNPNPLLQNDVAGEYWVFFTDGVTAGLEYGNGTAVLVESNSSVPMNALIGGSPSIALDFDYDNNAQAGRTPGTDANITVVAMGLDGAQHVVATGTITRSTTNSVALVASIDRQYENAA